MTATLEPLTYTEGRDETVHTIKVIEYLHGQPHSVITDHSTFDFDYCKRDDTIYFMDSGSGMRDDSYGISSFCKPSPPPGKIWTAPEVRLHRWESEDRPKVPIDDAQLLAMGYVRLKEPLPLKTYDGTTRNPFEAGQEHSGHMEYCSICRDYFPDDDGLCDHLCQPDCGEVVGAGGDPPNIDDMFTALDFLAALDWDDALENWRLYDFRDYPDAIHAIESLLVKDAPMPSCRDVEDIRDLARDSEQWDDIDPAFCWLRTLGKDTKKANARTLSWIMAWRLSRTERALAKERKALVKELESLAKTLNGGSRERPAGTQILAALGIPGGKRADLDAVPLERIREVLAACKLEALPCS